MSPASFWSRSSHWVGTRCGPHVGHTMPNREHGNIRSGAPAFPRAFLQLLTTELTPSGPNGPMCPEWDYLAARHGCRRFAAVSITAAGVRIGVLTLASRSPAGAPWSPDVLRSVAALLTVHTKRAAALLADVLPALWAAETVSQLVCGLGLVAAQAAAGTAHAEAGVRVALLQPVGAGPVRPGGEGCGAWVRAVWCGGDRAAEPACRGDWSPQRHCNG